MTVWEWHMVEEEKALRALRKVVDNTALVLAQGNLDRDEADSLMDRTREWVLKVFPDKEDTYELIYRPRFEKVYSEKRKRGNET